jgi:hypothetical protein
MTDKQQLPTHNIANKGFSGMQRFVARFYFSCNLTGNRPQSLTGHIVNRYALLKKETTMKKTIIMLMLFLFSTTNILFGQKISNIDFDYIKSNTQDSTSAFYYPVLIQKFLQLDTTLTDKEFCFIYYGNVYTDMYNPYGIGENEKMFVELYKEEKFQEAIPFGQNTLIENPVNLNVLYRMLFCYHKLGEKTTAKKYATLYFGLLNEIHKSGDGESIETAYVVVKVIDEYRIMHNLGLQSKGQALLRGPTDRITINTKNQKKVKGKKKISELYFNVAKPLEHMLKEFREKE